MGKKPKITIPENIIERFNQIVAEFPDIERKGVSVPYTSINGHMFSFLDGDGSFALRLSEKDREEFMTKHNTELMIARGRVMKDYVRVPTEVFNDKEAMRTYMQMSFDHMKTLKPKPTKKKK